MIISYLRPWSEFSLYFQVAGVVGRADLLCTLFYFLAFIAYCSSLHLKLAVNQAAMLLLSVVFCATAMFCKEQGITVIVSK
jgi:hypothetical protein